MHTIPWFPLWYWTNRIERLWPPALSWYRPCAGTWKAQHRRYWGLFSFATGSKFVRWGTLQYILQVQPWTQLAMVSQELDSARLQVWSVRWPQRRQHGCPVCSPLQPTFRRWTHPHNCNYPMLVSKTTLSGEMKPLGVLFIFGNAAKRAAETDLFKKVTAVQRKYPNNTVAFCGGFVKYPKISVKYPAQWSTMSCRCLWMSLSKLEPFWFTIWSAAAEKQTKFQFANCDWLDQDLDWTDWKMSRSFGHIKFINLSRARIVISQIKTWQGTEVNLISLRSWLQKNSCQIVKICTAIWLRKQEEKKWFPRL